MENVHIQVGGETLKTDVFKLRQVIYHFVNKCIMFYFATQNI